jgi:hypothetical protein
LRETTLIEHQTKASGLHFATVIYLKSLSRIEFKHYSGEEGHLGVADWTAPLLEDAAQAAA